MFLLITTTFIHLSMLTNIHDRVYLLTLNGVELYSMRVLECLFYLELLATLWVCRGGVSLRGNSVLSVKRITPSSKVWRIFKPVSGINGASISAISSKLPAWLANISRKWSVSLALASSHGFSSSMYWFKPRTWSQTSSSALSNWHFSSASRYLAVP